MGKRSGHDFHGEDAKRIIRGVWDRTILEAVFNRLGRPLSYFGLPGPKVEDLLEWRDLLGEITGVERLRPSGVERAEDLERHRRLLVNVNAHDIPNFQFLRGYIEDIIRDTFDVSGDIPKCNDGHPPHRMHFQYDLVNLDFLGGIAYRTRGGSKQVRALKTLFERQQGTSFVLLMTLSLRDKVDNEITRFLEETRDRASGHIRDVLNWYACCPKGDKAYKLKAVIPLFIKRTAEDNLFSCHTYPPVAYDGTGGAHMIHFAFRLTNTQGNFQAFSPQIDEYLLGLPLAYISAGQLIIPAKQHNNFDFSGCYEALNFLPHDIRQSILATAPVLAHIEEPA